MICLLPGSGPMLARSETKKIVAMDAQACYDFLKWLDVESLQGAVQESLSQSLLACEAGDIKLMLEMAQTARHIAWEYRDQAAQATALLHLGMAHARTSQYDQAISACEQARRLYHRNPAQQQRHGEGMAVYGLGLIFKHSSIWLYSDQTKAIGDLQARAAGYYQQALVLLKQAMRHYAAVGNEKQFLALQEVCQDIQLEIAQQAPIVYVDGKECEFVSVETQHAMYPELQSDTDYQPILVGEVAGRELGISPGNYILLHYPKRDEADVLHSSELHQCVWSEHTVFQQDKQGRTHIILPDTDEPDTSYVIAAIIKPVD